MHEEKRQKRALAALHCLSSFLPLLPPPLFSSVTAGPENMGEIKIRKTLEIVMCVTKVKSVEKGKLLQCLIESHSLNGLWKTV